MLGWRCMQHVGSLAHKSLAATSTRLPHTTSPTPDRINLGWTSARERSHTTYCASLHSGRRCKRQRTIREWVSYRAKDERNGRGDSEERNRLDSAPSLLIPCLNDGRWFSFCLCIITHLCVYSMHARWVQSGPALTLTVIVQNRDSIHYFYNIA